MRISRSSRRPERRLPEDLLYQPQIDVITGRIIGAEGLMRWNHPRRGFLPPNQFIAIAEECGLMTELGNWVIEAGCCAPPSSPPCSLCSAANREACYGTLAPPKAHRPRALAEQIVQGEPVAFEPKARDAAHAVLADVADVPKVLASR